jgi:hypothetical protein
MSEAKSTDSAADRRPFLFVDPLVVRLVRGVLAVMKCTFGVSGVIGRRPRTAVTSTPRDASAG